MARRRRRPADPPQFFMLQLSGSMLTSLLLRERCYDGYDSIDDDRAAFSAEAASSLVATVNLVASHSSVCDFFPRVLGTSGPSV